jgi:O-antigen ligase
MKATISHNHSMGYGTALVTAGSLLFRLSFALPTSAYAAVVILAVAREEWPYALVAGLLPLLFFRPIEVSLGLFAFLLPFDTLGSAGGNSGAGSSLSWYVGAGSGLVLLATGLVSRRFQRPPKAALWWGFFVLWNIASLLWALDPVKGLERLPSAICLFLLYVAAVSFRFRKEELRAVVVLAVVGAVIAAVFAAVKFAQGGELRAALVIGSREANPNDFASSLLLPFSLSVGAFLSAASRLKRTVTLAAAAIVAYCIFLTMSRGSLLALAALALVYLFRVGARKGIVVPIALIPLLLIFVPPMFLVRLQEGWNNRATGRFDIWAVGWQIVKHYGIVGAGLENFRIAYNRFAGYAPVFRRFDRDPHNIYLQVCAETGIVGLVLLVAAIWSQFRAVPKFRATQNRKKTDYLLIAVEAACWALLTHGLSANLLWRKYFWMSWILLAILSRTAARVQSTSWGDRNVLT